MSRKKDLQKFTETENKINAIMQIKKITKADIEILNDDERGQFYDALNEKFQNVKDIQRDEFLEQIDNVISKELKNRLWESNNIQIMNTIIDGINESGFMPHQSIIAEKTGLSRQTIHKHIKELQNNELFQRYFDQFKFFVPKMMGEVMRAGLKGDLKAMRLFLEYTAGHPSKNIGTQNNYIQINGMILTEEKLKQLPEDQLKTIEAIIATAEPQKINDGGCEDAPSF